MLLPRNEVSSNVGFEQLIAEFSSIYLSRFPDDVPANFASDPATPARLWCRALFWLMSPSLSSNSSKTDVMEESDAEEGEEEFVDAVFTLAEVSAFFKLQLYSKL